MARIPGAFGRTIQAAVDDVTLTIQTTFDPISTIRPIGTQSVRIRILRQRRSGQNSQRQYPSRNPISISHFEFSLNFIHRNSKGKTPGWPSG
jgi:hypothetical protein